MMKQKGLSQERGSIVMTEKENTAGNCRRISVYVQRGNV